MSDSESNGKAGTVLEFGTYQRGIYLGSQKDQYGTKLQLRTGLADDAFVETVDWERFDSDSGEDTLPAGLAEGDFIEVGEFIRARAYLDKADGKWKAFAGRRVLSMKVLKKGVLSAADVSVAKMALQARADAKAGA